MNKEMLPILREQDLVFVRNRISEYADKIKMGLVNKTKLLTAASELIRNIINYAGTGQVLCEVVTLSALKTGIRLSFIDRGPGITNIPLAMQDGYTTGRTLGLGLPGAKRLVNMFEIQSQVGKGTTITIIQWKNG
ncbi:MAG: anti-sigma regulatory factor [Chitinophagaceae bacterium]|nr:MAG: anti-sigma regulatory factor [Chitinophagaceae bacterium]